jgi:phosphoribosylamine--glycine ligase
MNILVIGSGGREHALTWKLTQSDKCDNMFVAPGNAGTATIARNVDISPNDFESLAELIISNDIDMVVVGPEDPLVNGIRDFLEGRQEFKSLMIIGPGRAGAQLEGSKDFSKDFMLKHGIPTATSQTFTADDFNKAVDYLKKQQMPIVLKADGLAAGKGVIIANTYEEAESVLKEMLLEQKFAEASHKVLIEEYLSGIELSVFVLTDGNNYKILPEAKDYKRIGDQDTGPNTGGMGAISPVPFAQGDFLASVEEKVVIPTLKGLKQDNIPFKGFLFIGLMNVGGEPYVIEYNVRMGDPESQVVIPRIKTDLVALFEAVARQTLDEAKLDIDERYACTVVGVAAGYPGTYEKGDVIEGLENERNAAVFQAGTKKSGDQTVTNGGRVIAVTGMDASLENAVARAYSGISSISWPGMNFRKDIGQDIILLAGNQTS